MYNMYYVCMYQSNKYSPKQQNETKKNGTDTFIDLRADNEVLRRQLDGNKLKINLICVQVTLNE